MKESLDTIVENLSSEIYKNFEDIVNTNSFTTNLEGNEKVASMITNIAKEHGIKLDTVYSSKHVRPHLMYQKELEKDFYAIIGHFDTVHPPKSGFDSITYEDKKIIGPGTNDMKSGIIIALYSLIILKKIYPDRHIPLKILFNSDEETGSTDSVEIIENEFKNAKAGFVFEPGRVKEAAIITGRKGICPISLKITGKPAHSGVAPWEGVNAIVAAAKIIADLDKLNDFDSGITVSSNEIKGGIATNVIAPSCDVMIDIRYSRLDQREELLKNIKDIFNRYNKDGINIEFEYLHQRPPFENNDQIQKLYEEYKKVSEFYGVECNQTITGGVSDANFLAGIGVPTIDGIGGYGNYSHTQKEYVLKDSLLYKIKIFVKFFSEKLNQN